MLDALKTYKLADLKLVGGELSRKHGRRGEWEMENAKCRRKMAGWSPESNRKQGAVELALADDGGEGAGSELTVQGHRNGDCSRPHDFLHDAVAAFLPDRNKTVGTQEGAKSVSGELLTPGHARLQIV